MTVEHIEKDIHSLEAEAMVEDAEFGSRHPQGWQAYLIPVLALTWSLFQLSLPKLLILQADHIRTIHLAFALSLAFLSFPTFKKPRLGLNFLSKKDGFHFIDIALFMLAAFAALYYSLDYEGITSRYGDASTIDVVVGIVLILLVIDAARRALGPALPLVAISFIAIAFFAESLPDILAFKNVSLNRFIGQVTASTEGIYGIPLDVSANTVFLFVLFGSLLERAGGGNYFVDLAFALMGRYKGGPAKASVLASACTGMISGSSIANTVTTGTFTIPLMKKVGYPDYKAGAIEVAASTNGQLTPPIMGAAAFIMAEYTGLSYQEVIRAAIIPAIVAYIGLFFIVHVEASKLGLKALSKEELPAFFKTLLSGLHYWIPLLFLLTQLIYFRRSPQYAAFEAISVLLGVTLLQEIFVARLKNKNIFSGLVSGIKKITAGLIAGAKNMISIGVATAAAGIVVAVVNMGLGGLVSEIVEFVAGNSLWLLLSVTAVASLILGMGLPTTANYIVMAALTAPLIVTIGQDLGLVVPLIAAHLFVFYFGILADATPPVGLAAYAASAISRADPIKTGVQGFLYDIRTAILPFMFIFNTDILLINVHGFSNILIVFVTAALGMIAFTAAVQRWFVAKSTWFECLLLLSISIAFFRPKLLAEWLYLADYVAIEGKFMVYIFASLLLLMIFAKQKARVAKYA